MFSNYNRPNGQVVKTELFRSLDVGSNPAWANVKLISIFLYLITNADWCNSSIVGSCPTNRGATPLSAFNKKGYSLIGRASCSW